MAERLTRLKGVCAVCGLKVQLRNDGSLQSHPRRAGRKRLEGDCRGGSVRATVRGRLLSHLIIDPSGCLLWDGSQTTAGYGVIKLPGGNKLVHRLMWEMFEGPIPPGYPLDHVKARGCANRHCASVAHLEPVPTRENVLRGDTIPAANAAKTKCINGHNFDEANTYWRPDGKRDCRTCRREADRRSIARKKAAA